MNVGIVTTWFERGAAMVSRAFRDSLVEAGNEVFIFARGGEESARGDPKWDGPHVTWATRIWGPWTNIWWPEFRPWAKRHALDAIIFNEQKYWPAIVLARRELRAAIGAYVDYYTSETVPLFSLYDFLICNTRRHYGVFQSHPGAFYVPWGTDCQEFRGTCEPVANDRVVFFHSAGMSPKRKGTLNALRAFCGLEGPGRFVLHLQARLEKFPEIEKLCAADSRIEVVNRTVGAPGLYHLGDVYVYPTVLEGIGLTIAEALACGLPVITPDVPPMNEFVRHGETGCLVQPAEFRGRSDGYYWAECYCTDEAVREAMQFYLDHRSELPAFKRAARAAAERDFDWRKNSASLGEVLQNALAAAFRRPDLPDLEHRALRYTKLPLHRAAVRGVLGLCGAERRRAMQYLLYGTALWVERRKR